MKNEEGNREVGGQGEAPAAASQTPPSVPIGSPPQQPPPTAPKPDKESLSSDELTESTSTQTLAKATHVGER